MNWNSSVKSFYQLSSYYETCLYKEGRKNACLSLYIFSEQLSLCPRCVPLFVTPWTAALQAPLSMGIPRQKYWNELPFLSPRDLPKPGIKHGSPALQADSLPSEPTGKPQEPPTASTNSHFT